MQSFETIEDAVRVAREVLSGTTDPHLGCGLIATISEKNNHPTLLQPFDLLSHEQTGHEHLGIDKSTTLPHIIDACRNLVGPPPTS